MDVTIVLIIVRKTNPARLIMLYRSVQKKA